jgi:hypothetical protein
MIGSFCDDTILVLFDTWEVDIDTEVTHENGVCVVEVEGDTTVEKSEEDKERDVVEEK